MMKRLEASWCAAPVAFAPVAFLSRSWRFCSRTCETSARRSPSRGSVAAKNVLQGAQSRRRKASCCAGDGVANDASMASTSCFADVAKTLLSVTKACEAHWPRRCVQKKRRSVPRTGRSPARAPEEGLLPKKIMVLTKKCARATTPRQKAARKSASRRCPSATGVKALEPTARSSGFRTKANGSEQQRDIDNAFNN